jgi:hypothetical protein
MPTYSGFKYESLTLTNVVLAFLIIVLSIQTKLGLKANILYDRVLDLWNGTNSAEKKDSVKQGVRISQPVSKHVPSQADYLDNSQIQNGMFPPAPVATSRQTSGSMAMYESMQSMGPAPANGLLGSSFGSSF